MAEARFSLTATRVQGILVVTLGVLVLAFVLAVFWDYAVSVGKGLLGVTSKRDLLTFLAVGMGGLLVALQAVMSYKRAKAMEDTARAQVRANRNVETGQRQQTLRDAIGHLGDASDSVRLGAAYQLVHLAQDTEEFREAALDILCAHIRRTTRHRDYQERYTWEPSEEIQTLLRLLFVNHYKLFSGIAIQLQGSWLNGADLMYAYLKRADLSGAHFRKANIASAQLQGSLMIRTQLQMVFGLNARLDRCAMHGAQLQNAVLAEARMRGANLNGAQMQRANLEKAQLQGALLADTQLQEALFLDTQVQGANPDGIADTPVSRIRRCVGLESDLSCAIFSGGMTAESLESISKNIPDPGGALLRRALSNHIDKEESNHPPEGVITGSYDGDQADRWLNDPEG